MWRNKASKRSGGREMIMEVTLAQTREGRECEPCSDLEEVLAGRAKAPRLEHIWVCYFHCLEGYRGIL